MSKNWLETVGKIAVFRDKETPKGTAETGGGVTMDFDSGSGINMERTIENNADMINGSELPSEIIKAMERGSGSLAQARCKPDFLAFALAYFLGECSSTSAGTSGYEHTITPEIDTPEHPSFTYVDRKGNSIIKQRFSGNHIDGFTLELGESFVTISADVVGWGKRDVNYDREVVSAPETSTQITLAANGVEGADAAGRLENTFRVRAKQVGANDWTVATVSAVSAATPAVIDIGAIGTNATNVDFHVDYIPTEPAWCTLPATIDESPLKLSDAKVVIDGYYNGTSVVGGVSLCADVLAFSIVGANNMEMRNIPCQAGTYYAQESLRGARAITIKISERLRNSIRQYQADNADSNYLAVQFDIRGAEIDVGGGYYFGASLIFPRCGILNAPIVVNGRQLASDGDLVVLDDGTYNGVVVKAYNKVADYLA